MPRTIHVAGSIAPCLTDKEYLESLPSWRQFFVDVGDWRINVISAGEGTNVLFLHGLGTSWRWWQPVIDQLVTSHTVIAIDLPGSGLSGQLGRAPTASAYADLVDAVIGRVGPSWVVGHSLGGFVGLQAAIHGIQGMTGLFLEAPAGFGPIANRYFRALALPGLGPLLNRTGDFGVDLLLGSLVQNKSVIDLMLCWTDNSKEAREEFLAQLRMGIDWLGRTNPDLLIAQLPTLRIPVFLVWGKHDSVFEMESALEAAEHLGLDAPHIAENSGHFVHMEESEWFVSKLINFIASS